MMLLTGKKWGKFNATKMFHARLATLAFPNLALPRAQRKYRFSLGKFELTEYRNGQFRKQFNVKIGLSKRKRFVLCWQAERWKSDKRSNPLRVPVNVAHFLFIGTRPKMQTSRGRFVAAKSDVK